MSTKDITVGFFGLSHLGIVSAISLGSKSIKTVGIDEDSQLVDELKNRRWPIQEPDLDKVYDTAKDFVNLSSDLNSLSKCDIVYISRDVPTDHLGKSDLSGIENLIQKASQHIPQESILVILCQVPPGFSRKMQQYHPNIYYQVETLIFGQALARANFPERIIVGTMHPDGPVAEKYQEILDKFVCPILIMNYESAEFTKICINAFLAASVTTTNALNAISKAVGADWDDIRRALQLDKRIGAYAYLQPGLGISGGNIERDLQTLNNLVQHYGLNEGLFETFLNNSSRQKNWIFETITTEILKLNPKAKIGILGLAYKENTHSTKNSMAVEVLRKFGKQIIGFYDPIAHLPEGMGTITSYSNAQDCIANSDAIVVMTPWKEFSELDFAQIQATKMEGFAIIDPYAILNRTLLPVGVVVKGLS